MCLFCFLVQSRLATVTRPFFGAKTRRPPPKSLPDSSRTQHTACSGCGRVTVGNTTSGTCRHTTQAGAWVFINAQQKSHNSLFFLLYFCPLHRPPRLFKLFHAAPPRSAGGGPARPSACVCVRFTNSGLVRACAPLQSFLRSSNSRHIV